MKYPVARPNLTPPAYRSSSAFSPSITAPGPYRPAYPKAATAPAPVRAPTTVPPAIQAPAFKRGAMSPPILAPAVAPAVKPLTPAPPGWLHTPRPGIVPTHVSSAATAIQAQINALKPRAISPEVIAQIVELQRRRDAAQSQAWENARQTDTMGRQVQEAIEHMSGLQRRIEHQYAALMKASAGYRSTMAGSQIDRRIYAVGSDIDRLRTDANNLRAVAASATALAAPRILDGARAVIESLAMTAAEVEVLYHQTGHRGPVPEDIPLSGAESEPAASEPEPAWKHYVKPLGFGLVLSVLVYFGSK